MRIRSAALALAITLALPALSLMPRNAASRFAEILPLLRCAAFADAPPAFLLKWGAFGTGPGQFDSPTGVALDPSGTVYVADFGNSRIQKFDGEGNFTGMWGTLGAAEGELDLPYSAVPHDGKIYVADSRNHRISVFDPDGAFLFAWGSMGTGDGQFNVPSDIAITSSGTVYVVDLGNARIQAFTDAGSFIHKWGTQGSADGQFVVPYGAAVDPSGSVFVVEFGNARVQKFTGTGVFLAKWGSQGSADGEFLDPFRIATDASGDVYIADYHNHRIQKFDNGGAFLTKWGTFGAGDGEFDHSSGIAVAPDGVVFAADLENHRIQKFGSAPVGVAPGVVVWPDHAILVRAWPNPFSQRTTIGFSLAQTAAARVRIFGADGAEVQSHEIASRAAGESRRDVAWEWDGRDGRGRALASGVYFARIEASGLAASHKIILAR